MESYAICCFPRRVRMGTSAAVTDAIPLLQVTHADCACPVCFDVFIEPVCGPCGHILCRACAIRCIEARPRCPLCNQTVPNMRHCVPLPQLALFCTLAREMGLRVCGRQPKASMQSAPALFSNRGHASSLKRRRGTTGDDAFDDTQEEHHAPGPQRLSPPLSPRQWTMLALRDAHVPLPGSNAGTDAGGIAIVDAQPENLPEFLHDAVGETQRLQSESPSPPPPMIGEGDALLGYAPYHSTIGQLTTSLPSVGPRCAGDTDALGRGQDQPPTPTPPPALSPSPASTSAPLQLLRIRLLEETDQLDSTPRLRSLPPASPAVVETAYVTAAASTTDRSCQASSSAVFAKDASDLKRMPAWSPLRRGQGVIHCTLTPPAARLLAREGGVAEGEALTVASRRSIVSTDATASLWHRFGRCVLCGLDVVERTAVRQRLHRLLRSPTAHCDPAELALQTEESLSLLLGPLWGVRCEVQSHNTNNTQTRVSKSEGEYTTSELDGVQGRCPCRGGDEATADYFTGVAHHNCLAWAGLLDFFTNTSAEDLAAAAAAAADFVPSTTASLQITVPLQDPWEVLAAHTSGRVARWQLLAATLWYAQQQQVDAKSELRQRMNTSGGGAAEGPLMTPHCALCEGGASPLASDSRYFPFGAGLRTCEGTERGESSCGQQFHYPCALLAGASACIVFGLEDERNVLTLGADRCVCDGNAGGPRSDPGLPVEVWCGVCHERHEARRRRK